MTTVGILGFGFSGETNQLSFEGEGKALYADKPNNFNLLVATILFQHKMAHWIDTLRIVHIWI